MIPERFGRYDINSLLKLTEGLKWFRYFPNESGTETDTLRAVIQTDPSADRKALAVRIADEMERKHPLTAVDVTPSRTENHIRIELWSMNEESGFLKTDHFLDARLIEQELATLGQELSFRLALPLNLESDGFVPEKYKGK